MTEWVEAAGNRIAYRVDGPAGAPALVFSHSLGAAGWMWRPQVEALTGEYRVVLVDTLGHGESAAPPGRYTVADLAAGLLQAVAAAGVEQFHMCGLSMGGHIGLWLASRREARLRSLIACNTAALLSTPEAWHERISAVGAGGMDSVREAVIERWFAPGFADEQPGPFNEANRVFAATSAQGYIGCCYALADSDLRDAVAEIETPMLIIGGAHDVATPPEQARWLHESIAGSELTVFDDAAHLSNLDVPGAFTDRLKTFLASAG